MSDGNGANNSWTLLTPENSAAETLRPLAEGTEHPGATLASAADSGASQAAGGEAATEGSPVAEHLVPEEKSTELIGGPSPEKHHPTPPGFTDAPEPTPLDDSGSFFPGGDALHHSGDPPEGPAQPGPDPDSFSDSYTHITPSPDEPSASPASPLRTETLGGEESVLEEQALLQEGTHSLNGEEPRQERDESDLSPRIPDSGIRADSSVDSEVAEERTQSTEEEKDQEEVRRRRRSHLAALERIGRTEEEEEREEVFQAPQRGEDSGFSVNKCILGAVILLGLSTIFFSEGDYVGTRELKDSEVPGKQEWLNPEVPPTPADTDSPELLNKLDKGNEQVLQVQLQAQELKVAEGHAAEGAKERLRWEEVEKENSRLKTEVASLAVLQKANEGMKRELDSVPALQRELETLRSTLTELKRSPASSDAAPVRDTTPPPSGQPEDSGQDTTTAKQARKPRKEQKETKADRKKEKYDTGEKIEGKEREKSGRRDGEKKERKDGGTTEWKKEKHEEGKSEKVKDKQGKKKKHSDETMHWKESEGKREKTSRGDEGKAWEAREGRKEWIEKSEGKDSKEVKDWKKNKQEKVKEGKREKDGKKGKDRGEKHTSREEWKGEKEWKKVKESGKEKWDRKDWKEKGEKKEWKKDDEWRGRGGKEGKDNGERKQWDESDNYSKSPEKKGKDQWKSKSDRDDKEWKRKKREQKEEDRKSGQEESGHGGDRKEAKSRAHKHKEAHKVTTGQRRGDEHAWGDGTAPRHTHRRRPPVGRPEYWSQQRERLRHNPKPRHCDSPQACARTERLLPVPFREFDAVLRSYLAKAEEAGVDAPAREELQKLAADCFEDGVFAHDRMSFRDFAEDVGDMLEDMVEGDEEGEEGDSAAEDEMEEFQREVTQTFSVPGEKGEGERRKESVRGRG